MTQEEIQVLVIKGLISELSSQDAKLCLKVAQDIRTLCQTENKTIGALALALVGTESQVAIKDE